MNKTKLLAFIARNHELKIFMSTQTGVVENVSDKKLEYYRKLNSIESTKVKPIDWHEAKPYESIPGPKPWPIIGNAWRFFTPKYGDFYGLDYLQIFKKLRQDYGDIAILKGLLGQEPMVIVFNPKDFEKMHRHEGTWPCRRSLPSFTHFRKMKKDVLPSEGLVVLQGEDWFKFRTIVNPILMQPQNIEQYTEKMNIVVDELVDNIRFFSQQNDQGQMPDDFQREIYKWSLESVGLVTLNTHLGCLKRDIDNAETQKLIRSVLRMFQLMYKLDVLPSLWKTISIPSWKEYVKTLDYIINVNLKYVNRHLEKIEKGEIKPEENEATSILHQLLKIDKTVAQAMSVDLLTAGVDTTGRILGAALYYLSRNQDKQDKIREEVFGLLKTKDSPVTKDILHNAPYTKAVVKETTRMAPIAIGNMRTLTKDVVLSGYQVPAGTNVLTSTLLQCQQEEHFPKAKEFIPERWLDKSMELSHKNPWVFAPFGYGPRSCIGKRLAHFELETTLLKIIRNFELKWPHDDMVFTTTTLHGMAQPLRIHVKEFDH